MKRLKKTDIARATLIFLRKNKETCPLCKESIAPRAKKKPVLDHDHKTGYIRDTLCRNCNGMEGKALSIANRGKANLSTLEWMENLVNYWKLHSTPQHGGLLHPTHQTPEEKRIARNKKARIRRAAAKRKIG